MYLVGVDCSTNPRNVGIALAEMGDTVRVRKVLAGISDPWRQVAEWLSDLRGQDALVALDAPLGWPIALSEALQDHSAGNPVGKCSNEMFRRSTDRHIKLLTGKQPLDVGADRIARTAHAALKELDTLRDRSRSSIPLAWCKDNLRGIHAIEVYPAATLKSHGLRCDGYKDKKDPNHKRAREAIANGLPGVQLADDCRKTVLENADGLDAMVCLLAAADFVRGATSPPSNIDVAKREGWIWCCDPKSD